MRAIPGPSKVDREGDRCRIRKGSDVAQKRKSSKTSDRDERNGPTEDTAPESPTEETDPATGEKKTEKTDTEEMGSGAAEQGEASSAAEETPETSADAVDRSAQPSGETDDAAALHETPEEAPANGGEAETGTPPDAGDTGEAPGEHAPGEPSATPTMASVGAGDREAAAPASDAAGTGHSRPGVLPLLAAGVVAAALGFAAARLAEPGGWLFPDEGVADLRTEVSERLDQQAESLNDVQERLDAVESAADAGDANEAVQALRESLNEAAQRLDSLGQTQEELMDRVASLESANGTSPSPGVPRELRDRIAALEDKLAQHGETLDRLTSEAAEQEESARQSARAALRRAALTRVQTALESGAPFASALKDLEDTGVDIPEALSRAAQEGVVPQNVLQERFPSVAREALSASRRAMAEAGETGGLIGLLRAQLGMRSLEPREGDDPDAILSRAEAAVRDGRLNDALAEIEALPEPGRAALSEWAGQATRRLEAVNAAEKLGGRING